MVLIATVPGHCLPGTFSNKYLHNLSVDEDKNKNKVYPRKPQFYHIQVGFEGTKFNGRVSILFKNTNRGYWIAEQAALSPLTNKNIKMSSFKSSENIQKKEGGPDRSVSDNQSYSVTMNELTMKARNKNILIFRVSAKKSYTD